MGNTIELKSRRCVSLSHVVIFLLLVSLWPARAHAAETKIPLFRYAMSNWETSPYSLSVLYNGDISEAHLQLLEAVDKISIQGTGELNLILQYLDVSDPEFTLPATIAGSVGDPEKYIAEIKNTTQLALMYPEESGLQSLAWYGPLTKPNIRDLQNSPLREKLIEQLVGGKTGVWILVECKDEELNDKAAAVINQAISKAKSELKLPPKSDLKDYNEDNTVPYQIDFSLIRLERSADAYREQIFASILAGIEGDLRQYYEDGDPLAIFIYGRGRTMAGSMFAETMEVDSAVTSMSYAVDTPQDTTASEQQAKDPSVDLLLTINWKEKIIVDVKQRMILKLEAGSCKERGTDPCHQFPNEAGECSV